jgi:hypothetical protein
MVLRRGCEVGGGISSALGGGINKGAWEDYGLAAWVGEKPFLVLISSYGPSLLPSLDARSTEVCAIDV